MITQLWNWSALTALAKGCDDNTITCYRDDNTIMCYRDDNTPLIRGGELLPES